MECHLMEKVSQLIDGELPEEEAANMTAHTAACEICRQAHADFLRLQRNIRVYDFQLEPFTKERALRSLIASRDVPFWSKRIAIPLPVMTALVIALVAVGLWSAMHVSKAPIVQTGRVKPAAIETRSQSTFDLSRFDHGERATIQKIKRPAASLAQ